uniref:Alanine--tRNA ligase n=1 Tax=Staphylothermus marinus TaxID=2280 RepID=A0A7C4JLK4_STAMA
MKEYKLDFPEELGFRKYKCRICGASFWSLVERDTCGDRPCGKYEFLRKGNSNVTSMNLSEARSKFINYFVSRGHGVVEPRPVVARWRDDLYLTIASIIVFQPFVTDGIADPPFNPLVITQPCVRLEDIDNVGYTFGRHLTSFEMGGHHAFNKKDSFIYWINETVKYSYEFFTRTIGINPENIVYKESWWEGGGNAGPSYEVIVDGLELATLVFMQFRVVGDTYTPMDVKVVDTGYGIERIAWFTQRTPTSYHAIFRDLVEKYRNVLNVEEPPIDVLTNIVYLLSDKEVRNRNEFEKVLREYGYIDYLDNVLNSINLYVTADHVRTLLLLLSDGVVPSNSGEGYLARLVLRRLLRILMKIGVEIHRLSDTILDLVDKQIIYWSSDSFYNKFSERRDYIIDVLLSETRRFIDTTTRGVNIVDRIIARKKNLSIEDLIEIYDSHGIPPDMVYEKASQRGIEVVIPNNFYSMIAKIHGGSGKLVKKEEVVRNELFNLVMNVGSTRLLFHENPYMREARAKVIGVKDKFLVLDQTIFYPKSGGQDQDTGVIVSPDGLTYRVVNVVKVGDAIVHELDTEPSLTIGEEVLMKIDWRRRYALMKHHTATHVLLGVLRMVLGDHVWQAGVEKTVEKARLDITHYKMLTRDEIEQIENMVNSVIDERIDLVFKRMNRFDAEKEYGFRIYQGGAIYEPVIRIVEIPGVDVEACFGTHVFNTSEIGGFKIIGVDRIQDGILRFEYTVGTNLPHIISDITNTIGKVSEIIGSTQQDIVTTANKIRSQLDEYKRLIVEYRNFLRGNYEKMVEEKSIVIGDLRIAVVEEFVNDKELVKSIIENLSLKKKYLVIAYGKNLIELATHPENIEKYAIDLREILEKFREKYPDTKGGGKKDHVTLRTDVSRDKLDYIIEILKQKIHL